VSLINAKSISEKKVEQKENIHDPQTNHAIMEASILMRLIG
jgi:hypothetical protein